MFHFNLETGKYYYTDVSKPHAVHNKADFDRLHLVVDCYNNDKIKNLLKQSEE
jgi:aspartyl/asparaginyl beta-hydroxylase (cupin superfamily)